MRAIALMLAAAAIAGFLLVFYYWIDTERVWRLNNK